MKTLTADELLKLVKQKGEPVLARTTENFFEVPKGTKLWFGLNEYGHPSSRDKDTNSKNKDVNLSFYDWDFTNRYTGNFELVESEGEPSLIIHCPTKEEANKVFESSIDKLFALEQIKEVDKDINKLNYIGKKVPSSIVLYFLIYLFFKNTKTQTTMRRDNNKLYYKQIYKQEQPALNNNKPMLKKLTKTLKRVLSKDLQAQYKADYINGDLELTERGREELLRILAVEKEKELADSARELIKEMEKK